MFITQCYFTAVPNIIGLIFTHYFIMKTPNKYEVHQIPFNHSSDIAIKDFYESLQKFHGKLYSSLVIHSCFRKNLLGRI